MWASTRWIHAGTRPAVVEDENRSAMPLSPDYVGVAVTHTEEIAINAVNVGLSALIVLLLLGLARIASRQGLEVVGARLFLKREDLTHTGAHKINNALGQALLAVRMGKRRIVAETGAGQHGGATATACALLGLDCQIYMGTEDMSRQALNVFRLEANGQRPALSGAVEAHEGSFVDFTHRRVAVPELYLLLDGLERGHRLD